MIDADPSLFSDVEEFKRLSVDEVLDRLVTTKAGLSKEEAKQRLKRFGPNAIEEKRAHPLLKFLAYFWGPIPWTIEIAAILSVSIRHWADFAIICALLITNAVVGFWQEHKAEAAIRMLKRSLAVRARVLRNGRWTSLDSAEVVPGDILRVRLGDVVPADLKLLIGDLLIDQSALTGESLPVDRHAGDSAYSSSVVQRGEADAAVVGTGMNTYIGKTARLVQEAETVSHYQKAILRIGRTLVQVALVSVSLVFTISLLRHEPTLETLQFALVLIVAAIPVALPAVLSVTLAVGAIKLAKRRTIVSRLVAIEELAGMDLLCCDKTGTLTKNKMVVGEPIAFNDWSGDDVVRLATMASRQEDLDPIEQAIFEKLSDPEGLASYEVESFNPFDPVNKRSEAQVDCNGRHFKVSKGAPQVIAALCDLAEVADNAVTRDVDRLAAKGYRALGVARVDEGGRWQFVGLLPLFDPPREDSAATIEALKELGVDVKMLTGDHLAIAREIAGRLGLGQNILSAESIRPDRDHDVELRLEEVDGYAQVFPEHKYTIVETLQERGHIVGMTGDGVNDTPALKKADVGIAVASATDAARSAADLVLTTPGLSVITEAVREGRRIFRRMTSYAIFRIAETIRVLLFLTLAIVVFNFFPITVAMLIVLALLNDMPIMMIAFDNAEPARRPVRWDMQSVLTVAAVLGTVGVISTFLLFWFGEQVLLLDRPVIGTLIFLKLAVAGHLTIYLARTEERPFFTRPWPSAKLLVALAGTQTAATLAAVYGWLMPSIGWKLVGLVWGYSLLWFLFNDMAKMSAYRLLSRLRADGHLGGLP